MKVRYDIESKRGGKRRKKDQEFPPPKKVGGCIGDRILQDWVGDYKNKAFKSFC